MLQMDMKGRCKTVRYLLEILMMCEGFHCCGLNGEDEVNCIL
jgi:hypothetical protein